MTWIEPNPWWYRARLVRVVDGDTQYYDLDCGLRIFSDQSIRIQGINCPELNTDAGKVARTAAGDWLALHETHFTGETTADWPFWVRTEKDHVTFNRYVGLVYCGQGHSLADDLVSAGQAVVWP